MKRYIQIYTRSADTKFHMLIEKCGSDAVIPLDGRWSIEHCISEGIRVCRANNYEGFRIMKEVGRNWNSILTDLYKVSKNTVEN